MPKFIEFTDRRSKLPIAIDAEQIESIRRIVVSDKDKFTAIATASAVYDVTDPYDKVLDRVRWHLRPEPVEADAG